MNAEKLKEAIAKLESLKGEDWADIVADWDLSTCRACQVMRGTYDDEENFTHDGLYHVTSFHWDIPPKVAQEKAFETAEKVFTDFIVNGKPLGEYVKKIEVNPPILEDW